jgi:hypothetical protein
VKKARYLQLGRQQQQQQPQGAFFSFLGAVQIVLCSFAMTGLALTTTIACLVMAGTAIVGQSIWSFRGATVVAAFNCRPHWVNRFALFFLFAFALFWRFVFAS